MKRIKFKFLLMAALAMLFTTVLLPFDAIGVSEGKGGDIPDVDGIYDVPGHKNLKARVFVHRLPAKPQPAVPSLVCSLSDSDSSSTVGQTGWKLPPTWDYSLNINSAPAAIRPYLETIAANTFSEWLAPLAGMVNIARDPINSTATKQLLDGKNNIAWGRTAVGTLGVTTTWYYPDTGEVVETDTIMSNKYSWYWSGSNTCAYSDVYDAQNILTHEIGHWFGLADHYSVDYENNTMYGYGSKTESKKNTLTAGDILGLRAIY